MRTAEGKHLPKRAVSGVEKGADFPIVWVSREEEWQAAQGEGREPEAIPRPAEDVSTNGDDGSPDTNDIAHRIVEEVTGEES